MPEFVMAWNDLFPPLNLWNYPMNFETEVKKRVLQDAEEYKKAVQAKQDWIQAIHGVAPQQPATNVSKVNDIQYGGNHYKTKAIQPWDYVAANNLGYFEGTIIKYITRYKDKNGIEDLKKARHFLDKLIEVQSDRT